jgi:hypothetical protein
VYYPAVTWTAPIIYKFIRGRRGVYALCRRGKPYYVGLASNLKSRLRTHLRDKHGVKWKNWRMKESNSVPGQFSTHFACRGGDL